MKTFATRVHQSYEHVHIDHPAKLPVPTRATEGSAGFDLRAMTVNPNDPYEVQHDHGGQKNHKFSKSIPFPEYSVINVRTGWRILIPIGYVGMVVSRSGLAANHGIFVTNSPGIIDSDYFGEIRVILSRNALPKFPEGRPTPKAYNTIEHGDRIAQLLFVPLTGIGHAGARPEAVTEIAEISDETFNAMAAEQTEKLGSNRDIYGFGSTGIK